MHVVRLPHTADPWQFHAIPLSMDQPLATTASKPLPAAEGAAVQLATGPRVELFSPPQIIQGTGNALAPLLKHMSVNHRGRNVMVTQ